MAMRPSCRIRVREFYGMHRNRSSIWGQLQPDGVPRVEDAPGLLRPLEPAVDDDYCLKVCTRYSEIIGKYSNSTIRAKSDSRNGTTPLKVSVNGTSLARRLMM